MCIHPNAPKIKQKLNQESQNWHTKKSENFTKFEMICTSKWFSSDVGKFEFTNSQNVKKIITLTQKHEPKKMRTLMLPWNSSLNLFFVSCVFWVNFVNFQFKIH
jgi:hypothetical protein